MKLSLTAKIVLPILCISLISSSSETPEQKGDAIAKKVFENTSGFGKYTSLMTMTLNRENGKSFTRKVRSLTYEPPTDLAYTISVFDSPSDVKGTKLLLHGHKQENDDQWIFLPSMNKTKRIANENKSGAFMGSEVAFEDMGNSSLFKNDHVYLRDEVCKGQECFVIKSIPKNKYSGYSYIENFVSKSGYLPVEDRFYDKKGELIKKGNQEYKSYNKFWLMTKLIMQNVKSNRSTTMTWDHFDFNAKIDASSFSPEKFSQIE